MRLGQAGAGLCQGVSTPRGIDVVNITYGLLMKNQVGEEKLKDYTVDISQCLSRQAYGERIRNLTTSSSLFAFGQDRLLTPQEHFNILGLPGVSLEGLSERQAKELAGQAMAAPCIALPLLCLAACLPGVWIPAQTAERQ